jgi:hypothetical protein
MPSILSHRLSFLAFIFGCTMLSAFIFAFPTQVAADTVYNLVDYPADQNGYTLSGYIVTDGKIGTLSSSNIKSWSFSINNGIYPPFSYNGGNGVKEFEYSSVIATTTQILLPSAATDPPSYIQLEVPFSSIVLEWDNYTPDPLYLCQVGLSPSEGGGVIDAWWKWNPQMGGTNPWVIAQTSDVPEPHTLVLLCVGAISLLAYTWHLSIKSCRCRRDRIDLIIT